MTRPAESVQAPAVSALLADRAAAAAAAAAREARLAADRVMPGRVENMTPVLIANARNRGKRGSRHQQVIGPARNDVAMAGIAWAAKYTMAAAHAARYAGDAAEAAGGTRAAKRAWRAAEQAASWAEVAQYLGDTSSYSPYTALMTAKAASSAAAAARRASMAAGPLGYGTTQIVGLASAVLPRASQDRYREEWKSDLCQLPRRRRAREVRQILAAALRLAVVLRFPPPRSGI
jgi:hypothetical protein